MSQPRRSRECQSLTELLGTLNDEVEDLTTVHVPPVPLKPREVSGRAFRVYRRKLGGDGDGTVTAVMEWTPPGGVGRASHVIGSWPYGDPVPVGELEEAVRELERVAEVRRVMES